MHLKISGVYFFSPENDLTKWVYKMTKTLWDWIYVSQAITKY